MRLNFTIQIASNDGIGLLADRHIDGRPRGKRQEFKELMKRWKAIHHRKDRLRAEIVKDHGGSGGKASERKGTSEEVAKLQALEHRVLKFSIVSGETRL